MQKQCRRCGETKSTDEFNRRAQSKDGFRPTCRACDRALRRGGDPVVPPPGSSPLPEKVIGRIVPASLASGEGPRIAETTVANTPEEIELAKQFAAYLNKGLPIKKRAQILIKIAKDIKGPAAALALAALRDINNATQVTSKTGQAPETAPMFVLPAGTDIKMSGR